METSNFKGDSIYAYDCTGDCCVGDEVRFQRATFTGSFRNAKFTGFETITGKIIADSYGADKQQHTFTLELENGEKLRIKGRNLYKEGVWRKVWTDEKKRDIILNEKHIRGSFARKTKEERLMSINF